MPRFFMSLCCSLDLSTFIFGLFPADKKRFKRFKSSSCIFFLVELQSNKALNSYWLHYEWKEER